ncbi:helix-turn-helix domain-containing protein [Paenalkalicoccus suaedae]|uniref:Helix-turn-helix domain-containing protein n=1 Tax=Paenalkalicoccus suaedae TaxID=2592382 RepID=A0A859FJA7_9BACI|nr:PTS sugar transporter subunit IIA [Paenalkalicoccus suaedae]QKS72675.1 helix-turn-helix domain-containing protein [Paenalkalicoccus suaedae]
MNERRRQLIQMVVSGNSHMKLKELEQLFQVGERTLRYDLAKVADWLRDYDIHLEHVQGKGMWELAKDPQPEDVREALEAITFLGRSVGFEERVLITIHELLIQHDWQSLKTIAEELDVSKGTVLQQMEQVEKWCNAFHLELERGRKGFILTGSEFDKRLALLSVMEQLGDMWDTVNPVINLNWADLTMKDIDTSYEILEQKAAHAVNHVSYFRVWILHVQRSRTDNWIEPERELQIPPPWFCEVWEELSELASLDVRAEEVAFAYTYLSARGSLSGFIQEQKLPDDQPFELFCEKISTRLGLTGLTRKQRKNIYGDWLACKAATDYTISYLHPLKKKVEEQYPFIVAHVWEVMTEEIIVDKRVRLDSLIPLIIGFAAIYEKSSYENERHQIWVVCPNGIAASRLLKVTLMKHFPQIEVKETLGVSDLKEMEGWDRPDFIISTITLHDCSYPYVIVKPVLSKEELKKIDQFMQQTPKKSIALDQTEASLSVAALIPNERVAVTGSTDLETIMQTGVALLEREGFVTKEFLGDLQETVYEKEYLYELIPGLLFMHTHSDHVEKAGFSLVHLETPYQKGDKINSTAVLFMATPDKTAHVPQLQYLYQLMMNEERVQELLHVAHYQSGGKNG